MAWRPPTPDRVLPPGLLSGLLFFAVVDRRQRLHHYLEAERFRRARGHLRAGPDHGRLCRAARRPAVPAARRPVRRQSLLHGVPVHADVAGGLALSVFGGGLRRADRAEFRHRDCFHHRRHHVADPVQPDAARSGRGRSHRADGTGRSLAAGEARTRKRDPGVRLFPAHDPAIGHRRARRSAGKHRPGASGIRRRIEEAGPGDQQPVRGSLQTVRADPRRPQRADRSGARRIQATRAGRRTARQEHRQDRRRHRQSFRQARLAPDAGADHPERAGAADSRPDAGAEFAALERRDAGQKHRDQSRARPKRRDGRQPAVAGNPCRRGAACCRRPRARQVANDEP